MRKLVVLIIALLFGAVSALVTYRYLHAMHNISGNLHDSDKDFDTGF